MLLPTLLLSPAAVTLYQDSVSQELRVIFLGLLGTLPIPAGFDGRRLNQLIRLRVCIARRSVIVHHVHIIHIVHASHYHLPHKLGKSTEDQKNLWYHTLLRLRLSCPLYPLRHFIHLALRASNQAGDTCKTLLVLGRVWITD